MTNVNLDNALSVLYNSRMLLKEKRMITFNIEYDKVLQTITGEHNYLKNIPLDAYFSVIELLRNISKFRIEAYLFGSYSKLIYKDDSDIDIAIISDLLGSPQKKKISSFARKISARYGKDIEIHYFSKNFYKNKKDPLVADILRNGVKLI